MTLLFARSFGFFCIVALVAVGCKDPPPPPYVCGDGTCSFEAGESDENCSLDCQFVCGNGDCEVRQSENVYKCPADCGWVAVGAGFWTTCAIKRGGSVWCWGENSSTSDFLGIGLHGPDPCGPDGEKTCSVRPRQVLGLPLIESLSVGASHRCVIADDSSAWCWGSNSRGELGDGTLEHRFTPAPVEGLAGVSAIDCGIFYSCAVDDQGSAWCWGENRIGQLGSGDTEDSSVVVPVQDLVDDVVSITTGLEHTCALDIVGDVYCWGNPVQGRLGIGDFGDAISFPTPQRVTGLTDVVALDAGYGHTCALTVDGETWCWGHNVHGALGDGTEVDSMVPVLAQLTDASRIAVNNSEWFWHVPFTCALSSGTAWCWGANHFGQLGDGSLSPSLVPVPAGDLVDLAEIAVGAFHTCAIDELGAMWCWGMNHRGQLGIGDPYGPEICHGDACAASPQRVVDPY